MFREVLEEEGFDGGKPISEAFFRERISGRSNPAICADLLPQKSVAEAEAFSAQKEQRFRDLAASQLSRLTTPGLERLIEWIDRTGVRTAAVTNAPRPNAELMLSSIGRLAWFETLVIGDECAAAKPDPEPYLVAMRRLGLQPAQCVALEDSPSGAAAAVAAGVRRQRTRTRSSMANSSRTRCPAAADVPSFAAGAYHWRALDPASRCAHTRRLQHAGRRLQRRTPVDCAGREPAGAAPVMR